MKSKLNFKKYFLDCFVPRNDIDTLLTYFKTMEKIAIYGGAFTPPTLGHKTVITSLLTSQVVDKIIFTPDGKRADKSYCVSDAERKHMIRLFFDAIRAEGWNIELEDFFLEGRNGSETTTKKVDDYFKSKLGFSPYHVFGIDVISGMPHWKGNENEYIEKKLKKILIPRKGFTLPSHVELDNFEIANVDIPEVSSTLVRTRISTQESISGLLIPEILNYINERKLFC